MSAATHKRGFRLLIDAAGDDYGIRLEQTNGSPDTPPIPIAAADPDLVGHVRDELLEAVRKSGHSRTVLTSTRKKPLTLAEAEGVRLALVLLAVGRSQRWERIQRITAGIAAMGVEETYYWYAKCMGPHAPSARRALRVLLTGERA